MIGRRRRARAPRKKAAKPSTTKALVRAVAKKVVADALEDKYALVGIPSLTGGLPVYFNASIGGAGECFPVLPKINQGTDSNQRVGDKIRPKGLTVTFTITANGSYSSSQLNQIRLFVLEDKSLRNLSDLGSTPIGSQLLDNGANPIGFSGIPNQTMLRVNKRRYRVFNDRIMTLASGLGQTPNASNAYSGTQTFVSTQQVHKVTFRIPTPAVLLYNATLDSYPTNFAPFMCLGYVQPDGNALPDNLLTRVACNFVAHLDYEDA